MGIDRIEPGWIGANLVIEGIPLLSMLPPRTQLFFEGGVTLQHRWRQRVLARLPERRVAKNFPDMDQTGLALSFVSAAKRRRGVVAWVEKPGVALPRVRPLPRGSGSSGSIPVGEDRFPVCPRGFDLVTAGRLGVRHA
jgi:hypothetical protein